jgi:hypothetical protein
MGRKIPSKTRARRGARGDAATAAGKQSPLLRLAALGLGGASPRVHPLIWRVGSSPRANSWRTAATLAGVEGSGVIVAKITLEGNPSVGAAATGDRANRQCWWPPPGARPSGRSRVHGSSARDAPAPPRVQNSTLSVWLLWPRPIHAGKPAGLRALVGNRDGDRNHLEDRVLVRGGVLDHRSDVEMDVGRPQRALP